MRMICKYAKQCPMKNDCTEGKEHEEHHLCEGSCAVVYEAMVDPHVCEPLTVNTNTR